MKDSQKKLRLQLRRKGLPTHSQWFRRFYVRNWTTRSAELQATPLLIPPKNIPVIPKIFIVESSPREGCGGGGVEETFEFRWCCGSKKNSRVYGKYTNFTQMSLFHIYIFGECFEKCRNQSRNRNTLCTRSWHSGLFSAKIHQKRRVACRIQSRNKKTPYSLPQQTVTFGFRIFLFPLWTRKYKFIRWLSRIFNNLQLLSASSFSLKGKVSYIHALRLITATGHFPTPPTSGATRHKSLTSSTLTETGTTELLFWEHWIEPIGEFWQWDTKVIIVKYFL